MKNVIKKILITILILTNISMVSSFCYASDFDISSLKGIYNINEIAGYSVASLSSADFIDDDIEETILSDLISEIRPFLNEVIDKNIEQNHKFSSDEVKDIIIKHPIKFITSIYNYAVFSIKNVFNIAEKYAHVNDK